MSAEQVVILSSIDWRAAWQRHQIFASLFAAAGHEVFFVENSGFRNPGLSDSARLFQKILGPSVRPSGETAPPKGLRVFSPKVLPPTFGAFRRINSNLLIPRIIDELVSAGLKPGALLLCYFATATTLELIRRLSPSLVVYDCASNFRSHPFAPSDFESLELELLDAADLVVCDSDFLFNQKRQEHHRVVQIHQGVSRDFFQTAPAAESCKRFCYYGTWSKDLDPSYLSALIGAGFEITVSGYVKEPAPKLPKAVRRLEPVSREKLPRRLEGFDGFLMPYRINPFLMGVVPAKIYECLALGRPILATPLPSLQGFSELIYLRERPADWVAAANALDRTENTALRETRVETARAHTHERQFERLREEIAKTVRGTRREGLP